MQSKSELRQRLLHQRAQLLPEEVKSISNAILARLHNLRVLASGMRLHCYEAQGNEISTLGLVPQEIAETVLVDYPGTKAKLPRRHELLAAYDVIVVPMLGFDLDLHRLGYGGGYYDRLLAAHPSSLKVGLCYDAGKLQQLPVEPHDIALDMIITEHRVYRAQLV